MVSPGSFSTTEMMTSIFVPVKSARFNSCRFFGFKSCACAKLANATAEIAATIHVLAIAIQSSLVCLKDRYSITSSARPRSENGIVGSESELVNVCFGH